MYVSLVCHIWLIRKWVRDSLCVTCDSFTNEFVTQCTCRLSHLTHSQMSSWLLCVSRVTHSQMSSWLNICVTCYVWLICKWVRDTLYVSCDSFTNEFVTQNMCHMSRLAHSRMSSWLSLLVSHLDSFTNEFVNHYIYYVSYLTHSQMSSWHTWLIHQWVRDK